MLQLLVGEGTEDVRMAEYHAHIVQGGVTAVAHDHAAPVQLALQQSARPLMQLHLHSNGTRTPMVMCPNT